MARSNLTFAVFLSDHMFQRAIHFVVFNKDGPPAVLLRTVCQGDSEQPQVS